MHVPSITFAKALARRLTRRMAVKVAAGTGITAALASADQTRVSLAVGPPAPAAAEKPPATLRALRTRRGFGGRTGPQTGTAAGRLSDCDGVALAVEWAPDGTLLDFQSRADVSPELAASAAQYGAAVSAMAPGLADAYAGATGFAWAPYRAVVVCGGEWAAVVGSDNTGVWVKAAEADCNQLIATLGPVRQSTAT